MSEHSKIGHHLEGWQQLKVNELQASAGGMPEDLHSARKDSRKRVLLLAYACSLYRGSEAGVGWHRAVGTAKYFETWVICGKQKCEGEVKRYISENGDIPGLHFVFVPEKTLEKWVWRFPNGVYLANNLWHRRAYHVAVRLHKKFHFDIVHQITWCGFREPGYLWRLDAPFIWGPVGGTQNYPWRFLPQAGFQGALKEFARSIVNILQLRFQPRVRKAARKAAFLLTANSTGKRHFERVHNVNPVLQLDVGITSIKDSHSVESRGNRGPLRILWSGLFKQNKALGLLILALSKVPVFLPYELRILGHGPMENRWRKLARQTGVEHHCKWTGWLPYDQAIAQYDWADVFVFTSLRDTCGTVVIEALSRGVPVVCLDHQGAGDVITKECGIKIPVTSPDEAISGLRDAIISIAKDRTKLEALSRGTIERAREYLWSFKCEQMAEIYSEAIDKYRGPDGKHGVNVRETRYRVSKGNLKMVCQNQAL